MNKEVDNNVTERIKEKSLEELWKEAYGGNKIRDDFYFDEDDEDENEEWYD